MSDVTPPTKPWYIALLEWLAQTVKDNWSGLAVLLWTHEEKKVEGAKQDLKTAQLQQTEAQNENKILKEYAGKSDADILDEFGKGPSDPNKPTS